MIVALVVVFEILGILSAVHAIMSSRTPQGSIAWAVSLVALPYVSVPAYWVFGRDKFRGYVLARQNELERAAGSKRGVGEVAVIPPRDREHPQPIKPEAYGQGDGADSGEKREQTGRVKGVEYRIRQPSEFTAIVGRAGQGLHDRGRLLLFWRVRTICTLPIVRVENPASE